MPQFDREAALSVTGGDPELLVEVIRMSLEECPRLLAELRGAIGRRDTHLIERSAHSLKGTVVNFGAPQVAAAAYAVEQKGKQGDVEGAEAGFGPLAQALDGLLAELREAAGEKA